MDHALTMGGWRTAAAGVWRAVWSLASRPWALARRHELNPWVFVAMAALGHTIEAFVFLPCFQTDNWQLGFLIALRLVALVVPLYIFLKGRGIAVAFNVSVAVMFVVNTTWHVCYYLYV